MVNKTRVSKTSKKRSNTRKTKTRKLRLKRGGMPARYFEDNAQKTYTNNPDLTTYDPILKNTLRNSMGPVPKSVNSS
tara:strand:+ start:2316 stop:2546 length:231 start_codon:yes stop_codon:yes gene_type:complete